MKRFSAKTEEPRWFSTWGHQGQAHSRFFIDETMEQPPALAELQVSWRLYEGTLLTIPAHVIHKELGKEIASLFDVGQLQHVLRDIRAIVEQHFRAKRKAEGVFPGLFLASILLGLGLFAADKYTLQLLEMQILYIIAVTVGPPTLMLLMWIFFDRVYFGEAMLVKSCCGKLNVNVFNFVNALLASQGMEMFAFPAKVPCWRSNFPCSSTPSNSRCYAIFVALRPKPPQQMQPMQQVPQGQQIQAQEQYLQDQQQHFPQEDPRQPFQGQGSFETKGFQASNWTSDGMQASEFQAQASEGEVFREDRFYDGIEPTSLKRQHKTMQFSPFWFTRPRKSKINTSHSIGGSTADNLPEPKRFDPPPVPPKPANMMSLEDFQVKKKPSKEKNIYDSDQDTHHSSTGSEEIDDII